MIGIAVLLGLTGLLLSAFFSGSETGFYRVAPVRLQLDALAGDRKARFMLWLTNHPPVFVATVLVGNNLANYSTSLAIVMLAQACWPGDSSLIGEMLAPLAVTPFLFVYGELLPKYLFLHAPNRLLRMGIPLFVVFIPLFAPISVLLYGLNRLIAMLLGQSHDIVRPRLARHELRRALDEGHHEGILRPSQWKLAQGLFASDNKTVADYVRPLSKLPRGSSDMTKSGVLRAAQRHGTPELALTDAKRPGRMAGYVRVVDLRLSPETDYAIRPLLELPHDELPVEGLLRMQAAGEEMALVVGEDNAPLGILTAARLRELLFHGGKSHKREDDQ